MDQGLGRHSNDLAALKPTEAELLTAVRWVLTQDAGESFPQIVRVALKDLGYGHLAAEL
jgi:hypothetical protein